MMKKCFITGLAILLPAVLTLVLFMFVVNFLTEPFVDLLTNTLRYYNLLDRKILFFSSNHLLTIFSRAIILILLFLGTIIIGLLTRIVFFHYLIRLGNYILHRIPFVNKIYKAIQDVMKTIFGEKKSKFSQVVLVPFPYGNTLSLGLITNESATSNFPDESSENNFIKDKEISVFVPATPNPTMGFILQYKKEQIIPLKMTVEEAIKFIVSCGVMSTGFDVKTDEIH